MYDILELRNTLNTLDRIASKSHDFRAVQRIKAANLLLKDILTDVIESANYSELARLIEQ